MVSSPPPFDPAALCRVLFEHLGLPPDAELAVGYSGGHDSHVLLHALSLARRDAGFGLTALHFDHGLQPQSAQWARRCAAVCESWGIAFVTEREALVKAPGMSVEALARRRRYRWFARVVAPQQTLLTAHHANDQAETVLLNLLRGGALASLAGIAESRTLSAEKSTRVLRPLLRWERAALSDYARRHALTWIEDPSNQRAEFDRNYLRHAVIPLLEKRWHAAVHSLARGAERRRDAVAFLDETAQAAFDECRADEHRGVFCLAPPLAVCRMRALGRFQIQHLIRHWAHRHGRRSPSAGQLATLFAQVFEAHSARAAMCWDDAEVRAFNGNLHLLPRLAAEQPRAAIDWDMRPRALGVNGVRVELGNGELDPARLRGKALKLVWRRGGERIRLPGRAHHSALKKLFQQHAVPPWERRALPLLVVDGEIAWAHRIGASVAYHCGKADGIGLRFVAGATSARPVPVP